MCRIIIYYQKDFIFFLSHIFYLLLLFLNNVFFLSYHFILLYYKKIKYLPTVKKMWIYSAFHVMFVSILHNAYIYNILYTYNIPIIFDNILVANN